MDLLELESLKSLASAGSSEACLKLSEYYLENKENRKSFETLYRAINLEDKDLLRRIGYYYSEGIGVEKNIDNANKCYQKAFELGDYLSGYNLALYFINKKDYASAVNYLTYGVNNDHTKSIKLLASFYFYGYAVDKDINIALNLFIKGYDLGETSCAYNIGYIYLLKNDLEKSFQYYYKGALAGDIRCIKKIVNCYINGEGVNKNYSKAIFFLEEGKKMHDIDCIKKLSEMYQNGIGVKKDIEYAEVLLKLALDLEKNQ